MKRNDKIKNEKIDQIVYSFQKGAIELPSFLYKITEVRCLYKKLKCTAIDNIPFPSSMFAVSFNGVSESPAVGYSPVIPVSDADVSHSMFANENESPAVGSSPVIPVSDADVSHSMFVNENDSPAVGYSPVIPVSDADVSHSMFVNENDSPAVGYSPVIPVNQAEPIYYQSHNTSNNVTVSHVSQFEPIFYDTNSQTNSAQIEIENVLINTDTVFDCNFSAFVPSLPIIVCHTVSNLISYLQSIGRLKTNYKILRNKKNCQD